ncbi:unnamed protein product [Allacma fusca]|uniref:Uncharacterized protein n=1 Tax=Allacma fusca TaxID=39272 RepID=A0A8J2P3U8_9HEXA|nr:unnamed protein product [Allacma fusca]
MSSVVMKRPLLSSLPMSRVSLESYWNSLGEKPNCHDQSMDYRYNKLQTSRIIGIQNVVVFNDPMTSLVHGKHPQTAELEDSVARSGIKHKLKRIGEQQQVSKIPPNAITL